MPNATTPSLRKRRESSLSFQPSARALYWLPHGSYSRGSYRLQAEPERVEGTGELPPGYPVAMQIAGLLLPMMLLQAGGKLEIKDTKVGAGPAAVSLDLLTMDYTGKLADGTEFDSSKKPGRMPFTFVLGGGMVIKGWDQGIVGMKVGGKRTLVIPPDLAYGAQGRPSIPPNSTLTFDVELKGIHKCEYKIIKAGTGPEVKGGDSIEVHYTGTLENGKKFDSSKDHGAPMPVTVGRTRLVPGFTQALYGMKVGEVRKVTIPAEFAYGTRGAADTRPGAAPGTYIIPPNSTLIFELELVRFLK